VVRNTRSGGVYVIATPTSHLEVRFARNRRDVKAAQLLRYRIFYKEMGASANLRTKFFRRDFDHYDRACDHLLVVDRRRLRMRPVMLGSVVGTCRLIRRGVADQGGGFYSAGEFDLAPLLRGPGECVEVGRSCVDPGYRTGAVIDRMWRAIADYIVAHQIGVLFGCASLPGTRPEQQAELLSYLYHHHLAPEDARPRAVASRYVDMCMRPADQIDPKRAWAALPPLLKGYLRLGAKIGDGAVVDEQFNTTDVCIVLQTARLTQRYLRHYRAQFGSLEAA
jgi:L-ornithine Nalpha-acyltransferase